MTNEEMMIILERALLVPVKESDAAYILAINESRPTLNAADGAYALGMPVEIANWLAPGQWFLRPPHRR